jgi:hypothetical protein
MGQDRKHWPAGQWPGSYRWRNEGSKEPTPEETAARKARQEEEARCLAIVE